MTDPRTLAISRPTTTPRPLEVNYDPEADVLTVEGIPYAGDFFRRAAAAQGVRRYAVDG